MESIIAAVCQAVSQAAPPGQRQQAGSALLSPVLGQLRDAVAGLPAGAAGPGLSAAAPHLNPLVDRLAEVFARTGDQEVVAWMLSEWGGAGAEGAWERVAGGRKACQEGGVRGSGRGCGDGGSGHHRARGGLCAARALARRAEGAEVVKPDKE